MTRRTSPTRNAKDPWEAFRANGRTHHKDAQDKLVLLETAANAKGVASDAVLAAIAFGDAITVQRLGQHNTTDHGALPKLVQIALGKDADQQQVNRLKRIIAEKGDAHYGGRFWTRAEAETFLDNATRFISWAEAVLQEYE